MTIAHVENATPEQSKRIQEYFDALPGHLRTALAGMSAVRLLIDQLPRDIRNTDRNKLLTVALVRAVCQDSPEIHAACEFHTATMESFVAEKQS